MNSLSSCMIHHYAYCVVEFGYCLFVSVFNVIASTTESQVLIRMWLIHIYVTVFMWLPLAVMLDKENSIGIVYIELLLFLGICHLEWEWWGNTSVVNIAS